MDAYKLIITSKTVISKFLVVPTFHRSLCVDEIDLSASAQQ